MAKKGTKTPTKTKKVAVTTATEVAIVEKDSLSADEGVILSPQQALFLQLYYDRESPTWGNAKRSALSAGFSESMANQITYLRPRWFVDFCRQNSLIEKIEEHFREVMNLPNVAQAMGAFGPLEVTRTVVEETGEVFKTGKRKGQPKTRKVKVKEPVYVPNVAIIKAKNEVAKIAAPAHDPDRYGKKVGNNNKFIFNINPDRQKFA